MEAFTQFNPRVCITEDDLELNTLYPDRSHALTGSPVCFKSDHNIGWVRLAVWLGTPGDASRTHGAQRTPSLLPPAPPRLQASR